MIVSRRSLLAGLAAGTVLAPSSGARTTGRAQNLLVVLGYGGWDTTFSIDPKEVPLAPVAPGRMAGAGDLQVWNADGYPGVLRCFQSWGSMAHVVRGLAVRSLSHVGATRRLFTASADPARADLGAIIGTAMGNDRPVPYLVLGVHGQPGEHAATTGMVGSRNQLADLTADRPFSDPDQAAIDTWLAGSDRRLRERPAGPVAETLREQVVSGRERAAAMIGWPLGESGALDTFDRQAELAIQALSEGLSSAVMMDGDVDFDTHSLNHLQVLHTDRFFRSVDGLLERLATTQTGGGRVLLDDTLVLVASEMTRTARLNAESGKDHWPWASVVLFGAGVRSGLSGGTDGEGAGLPTNPYTGALDGGAGFLQAEHLFAGLLRQFGVDPAPYTTYPPLRSPFG